MLMTPFDIFIGILGIIIFGIYCFIKDLIMELFGISKMAKHRKELKEKLHQQRLQRIQEGRPWQTDLEWLQEHPDGI